MSRAWDPTQYVRFADHRIRPALELLARIDHHYPASVVDLGCGTGEMARIMKARWADAQVTGLDHSSDMLREASAADGEVGWQKDDITTWTPDRPVDVIFSNAALHWLPDHRDLFPRLTSYLAPGGVLAVQMPLSWPEPSHVLMREILEEGGLGRTPLGPESLRIRLGRNWVADPTYYYDILTPLVDSMDIWTTRYLQVLQGFEPVFEWVKGTGLRPVLESLDGPDLDRFVAAYREGLIATYPPRGDGTTIYPFPRLFIVAKATA